ncbi:DUF4097 domain-containing protein [Parasphingorhabdus halotolerans]|uniref:DUF4097 domain-containing protein n=1 Tax=Parasphingorhabdus halotolerans TaxID=2725558 RepID=A0A6H2DMM6_9SPHN|nr:DUF4097 domain-containing protein [Parasphingorhabdus halotolerans]QJB69604.1 DUF4097 domain-containing protein [Parasphingorhabdus halotolerans]
MTSFSTRKSRIASSLGKHVLVSTLALAAASAANAQVAGGGNSYDAGDPTIASGSVTFDRTGTPNTETYTINSNTAVLDFIPNDMGTGGPINFQFAGTIAQYLGGLGITDFTVLNRIFAADPSRAIQLNGTIISRLQASPTTPGGSVWFYSPGGIVVGSTAVIDVGNLLLAAGDPTGGSGVITNPNQFTINSVPDSGAAITVQAGAQITTSNPGSYVALVAPAIIQSGTVSTNGSAAYVAAEQTTLTFNSGLFNIQTTVGSNANSDTPLVHDGTTRFIDDTGARRAYLVSVAKNDAITMLIEGSGQLGFDMATGVNIDNGVVVLSGGYDVNDTTYTNLAGTAGALRHDIQITSPTNNADIQGQVNPFAASEIRINSLGQAQSFAGDVSMNAGALASLTTQLGGTIDIVGDLDLSTLVYGFRDANFLGGNVVIDASLGNISIGGNTSLTSFTDADFLGGIDPAGTVQGGTIAVIADNGNAINMFGNLDVLVEANGADQLLTSQTSAGNAVGGNIIFASSAGSTLSVGGNANINSTATGGIVQLGSATAGNATGGAINIFATDGDISFGGNLSVSATGRGGQVNASGTTAAGTGTGGQINITVGTGDLTVGGGLTADVSGFGGSTQFATSRNGGDGTGGTFTMNLVGTGNIDVGNDMIVSADGSGSAAVGAGNNGGSGIGGSAQVLALGGAMNFGGIVSMSAFGRGESGSDNSAVIAQGGTLALQADTGAISIGGNLDMFAQGLGQVVGAGQDGANAVGGSSIASATNGGTLDVTGIAVVSATAVATGSNGGINSRGGDAQGGNAQFVATGNGVITIGQGATASAGGFGGDGMVAGTSGGDGTGGTASISQGTGGLVNITVPAGQSAVISTDGIGGASMGGGGLGGNGTGGDSRFVSNDGTIVLNGALFISAQGEGGASDGISGGDGIGGLANIGADTGLTQITGNATVRSAGIGGAGTGTTTDGGDATGGSAIIGTIGTGAITIGGTLNASANAVGGIGTGASGGNAIGGTAQIFSSGGGTANIAQSAVLNAQGTGGASNAQGGNGTGGFASILTSGTSSVSIGAQATLDAVGEGGSGADGGNGLGGTAQIAAIGDSIVTVNGGVQLRAQGRGGAGLNSGGDGTGGFADVSAADPSVGGGTINIGPVFSQVRADGIGGDVSGTGGTGGNGTGGFARIYTTDGSLTFNEQIWVVAGGNGGNVTSGTGNGGDGNGGNAQAFVQGPGIINALAPSTGPGSISLRVASSGFGGIGSGIGFSGGDGTGGLSTTQANGGGTINIAGGFLSTASGFTNSSFTGLPAPDFGGTGTGGTVNVIAGGGTINGTSDVSLVADGIGGEGFVTGGNGIGGQVLIAAAVGLIDFTSGTGDLRASAFGTGGNAATEVDASGNIIRGGGDGGDGVGGAINLVSGLAGIPATGELRLGNVISGDLVGGQGGTGAIGGAGAAGAAGQDGGDGGDATTGIMFIGANAANGILRAGNVTMGSVATAGAGGLGGLADAGGVFGNGGDGGDAFGRSMGLGSFTDNGASTTGFAEFGDIIMDLAAIGGNGGNAQGGTAIGGTGGAAREGTLVQGLSIAGPFIISRAMRVSFNDATLTGRAVGGNGGVDAAGGRSAGGIAEGFATSLSATFGFVDNLGRGLVTGNAYSGSATSQGGLGVGDIRENSFMGSSGVSAVGGDLQLASAIIETRGLTQRTDVDRNLFAPFAFVAAIDGIIDIAGDVTINSDNEFNLIPIGSGEINIGNDLIVNAGLGNNQDVSPFGPAVDELNIGNNVILNLGGNFVFAADIDVVGQFSVNAQGLINTANIAAGAGINLQSGSTITTSNLLSNGNISLTGMANPGLGLTASILTGDITSVLGLIDIVTNIGDITVGNLTAANGATVTANTIDGGDIVIGGVQASDLNITGVKNLNVGDINVTNAATLSLVGSGAINAGNISAGNDISLTTGIGDIDAGSIQSANGAVQMTTGDGAIQTAAISAGTSVNVNGSSGISISGVVTANQSASFDTNGTATFGGLVDAANITVTSSNIVIGTNGGLGSTNTNDLEINALGIGQPIIFGGDGTGGGYNLSAIEATKLRSRTIRFNAQQIAGPAADITIRDFTLQGSLGGANANLLASDLFINSPGNIRLIGNARIENAGVNDMVSLRASGRVEIVTDQGGQLRILGANGAAAGRLDISAQNLWVGTQSLLSQLAANSAFAGREDAIAAPDGTNRPEGNIEAGAIAINGNRSIIIQNSNTAALRGGFTAGAGGLTLSNFGNPLNSPATDVFVNGRILSAGSFLENATTRNSVVLQSGQGGTFASIATANGCLLSGGTCTLFDPPAPPPTNPGPDPVSPQPDGDQDEPDTIASDVREIIHGDDQQGESEDQEEEERAAELQPEATGKKSPIAPNVPVVNTKRLSSSPIIADPITGSGNPNFISRDLGNEPSPPPGIESEGGL